MKMKEEKELLLSSNTRSKKWVISTFCCSLLSLAFSFIRWINLSSSSCIWACKKTPSIWDLKNKVKLIKKKKHWHKYSSSFHSFELTCSCFLICSGNRGGIKNKKKTRDVPASSLWTGQLIHGSWLSVSGVDAPDHLTILASSSRRKMKAQLQKQRHYSDGGVLGHVGMVIEWVEVVGNLGGRWKRRWCWSLGGWFLSRHLQWIFSLWMLETNKRRNREWREDGYDKEVGNGCVLWFLIHHMT